MKRKRKEYDEDDKLLHQVWNDALTVRYYASSFSILFLEKQYLNISYISISRYKLQ